MSFLYGTIFISKKSEVHSKNVCVFADGEVDRSPTGSGVSGRAAIHYKRGEIAMNESITIESILGSKFDVKVIVKGGGLSSQSDATRHGIAKALELFNPELRLTLKSSGLLTRDSRRKERKKPGLKKARKSPQWSKR